MSQPLDQKLTSVPPPLPDRLKELAQLFLKLSFIGFGGPQAHIAMIHDEAVVRQNWLTEEQFLEGVSVCEMLPGPASTQVGIYTGFVRAGYWGALVAGFCFIFPAFLIVLTLSWAYFRFQGVPQIDDLFLGVSPVVIAIIFGFCWKLSRKAIKDWGGVAIALAVFLITITFRVNVLLQFVLAGVAGLLLYHSRRSTSPPPNSARAFFFPFLSAFQTVSQTVSSPLAVVSTEPLAVSSFWGWERIQEFFLPLSGFFLKAGSFIFGGGLVIIPLLEFEVVNRFHWLTQSEFIDGVAIAELTPGPVVIAAAFVGYKVAGVLGAIVASVAIFTPSFVFIMGAAPLLTRIRQNPRIRSFLKGVTPAVLGAIAAAAIPLAQAAIGQETLARSVLAAVVFMLALVALIWLKRPTWQLVPVGAVVGLVGGAFL